MAKQSQTKHSYRIRSTKKPKQSKIAELDSDNNIAVDNYAKFTPFPKLPIELRRMVWLSAFPKQRVITITANGYKEEKKRHDSTYHHWVYRAKATYTVPSLLQVHGESRMIGQEIYRKAFGEQLGGRAIWFNFNTDILFFEDHIALAHFHGGHLPGFRGKFQVEGDGFGFNMVEVHQSVQSVMVGYCLFMEDIVGGTLNRFHNLQTVYLEDESHQNTVGEETIRYIEGSESFGTVDQGVHWDEARIPRSKELGNLPNVIFLTNKERIQKLKDLKVKINYPLEVH
jgi:hypothetical protein